MYHVKNNDNLNLNIIQTVKLSKSKGKGMFKFCLSTEGSFLNIKLSISQLLLFFRTSEGGYAP